MLPTTPRDAFLGRTRHRALDESQHVSSALRSLMSLAGPTLGLAGGGGGGAAPQLPRLSQRSLVCLRARVAAAIFLAETLGSSRFVVLEAPQIADYRAFLPPAPPGPAPLVIGAVAGTPSK
jgi:hypothetical protein